MTANVRCAGGGLYTFIPIRLKTAHRQGNWSSGQTTGGEPCGWKGERKGGNRNLGPLPAAEFYAELRRRMTELPCPRCGGRVEIIPGRVIA
ncbi:MAG TPA: hypothetical protein VIV12_18630 [Streptosporangiaceae bacterium]